MKQIVVLLLGLGVAIGASARPGIRPPAPAGGSVKVVVAPRPIYRPYYYNPYSAFGRGYGYPYYGYGYSPYWGWSNTVPVRESKADLAIQEVRNDYGYQISNVRHDKSLTKQERKDKIRELKHEREQAVIEAKRKYY